MSKLDEIFSEEFLQPGMVIDQEGVMWRFNPEWKKETKRQIKDLFKHTIWGAEVFVPRDVQEGLEKEIEAL